VAIAPCRKDDDGVLLAELVEVSATVAGTPKRLEKIALIADALEAAGPQDVAVVVPWLSGELRQRRTGIGWASLRELPPPAAAPGLTISGVDADLETAAALTGPGSGGRRRAIVTSLLSAATPDEQRFLRALLSGELRQGALDGVMVEAIARASGTPLPAVRRAAMLAGSTAAVAILAMSGGESALAQVALQVGRPVSPMLASTAASVPDAVVKLTTARLDGEDVAVDWKIDGIRVQVHRDGDVVRVFTRSLDDITGRMPELEAAARELPVHRAVLDGEAIVLGDDGRPRPFQETGSRSATRGGGTGSLSWFVFDALHIDGADLLDLPLRDRDARLRAVVPERLLVPRHRVRSVDAAQAVLTEALARGHEGVVVKSLDAPYAAGRRGASWLKVKPVHTLDLVVLAAEWGSGRRRGWLSNLHLGARDPEGGFVMLGKTFKGLTDELLGWQTDALQRIEVSRDDRQVTVAPTLVVEIAFDGVQRSTRYPGGVALRFARVVRYREDKTAASADTIDTVRAYLG
jgi:DNA ligase-1